MNDNADTNAERETTDESNTDPAALARELARLDAERARHEASKLRAELQYAALSAAELWLVAAIADEPHIRGVDQ